MLSENEANSLLEELVSFRHIASSHADTVQAVVTSYEKLVGEYKSLLLDYEETKEARDRYKRQVRQSIDHPFALVLIDGEAHPFDPSLVGQSPSGDGGQVAADLCSAALANLSQRLGLPSETKIVVRYFFNLSVASIEFHRLGVLNSHGRALAPFANAFTRHNPLFDTVDVGRFPGDLTSNKIRENFELFIDNPSCKHIFFAACSTESHLELLAPYERQLDRITLIRNSDSLPQFFDLGLRCEELTGCFHVGKLNVRSNRSARKQKASDSLNQQSFSEQDLPLEDELRPKPEVSTSGDVPTESSATQHHSPPVKSFAPPLPTENLKADPWASTGMQAQQIDENTQGDDCICRHHTGNKCRFGDVCAYRHATSALPVERKVLVPRYVTDSTSRAMLSNDWRRPAEPLPKEPIWDSRVSSFYTLNASGEGGDGNKENIPPTENMYPGSAVSIQPLLSGFGVPLHEPVPFIKLPSVSSRLPPRTQEPQTKIPLNAANQRLDLYPGPFKLSDAATLEDLRIMSPPCWAFHTLGACLDREHCKYHHSHIPDRFKTVMYHQSHQEPCPEGSGCRYVSCLYGHICWDSACTRGTRFAGCRLPDEAHGIDPVVTRWVNAADATPGARNGEERDKGTLIGYFGSPTKLSSTTIDRLAGTAVHDVMDDPIPTVRVDVGKDKTGESTILEPTRAPPLTESPAFDRSPAAPFHLSGLEPTISGTQKVEVFDDDDADQEPMLSPSTSVVPAGGDEDLDQPSANQEGMPYSSPAQPLPHVDGTDFFKAQHDLIAEHVPAVEHVPANGLGLRLSPVAASFVPAKHLDKKSRASKVEADAQNGEIMGQLGAKADSDTDDEKGEEE